MDRKSAVALAAAGSLAASLGLGGCSQVADQLSGARAASASDVVATAPILETRHWAVIDGMLSVVVQNTTDRTLRYAEGVVTATSEAGEPVVASQEAQDQGCCGVDELAPGQQYGFYLDVPPDAQDQISDVDVAYRNISWAPTGASVSGDSDRQAVSARPTGLQHTDAGAVVLADLRSRTAVTEVVVQAFVDDRDGDFLAVVSGRWTCLRPGARSIRMELFHPLPQGARVDRVLVHQLVDDPTRATPRCSAGG